MGKAVELCPLEGGGRSWQWRRLFGCCRNLVPRGRRLCSVRNRYADWVQAQPAAGEGAALFPVGGRRGASLSPAADRGKGAALFSAEGGFNLVSRGRKWGFVRNRYVIWVQAQPARKTSHREVFLGCANRKFVRGAFLLQKPPLLQAENQLAKFTRKGVSNAKVFRALRSSTSRRCPLDTRFLLKRKRNLIW